MGYYFAEDKKKDHWWLRLRLWLAEKVYIEVYLRFCEPKTYRKLKTWGK